MKIIIDENYGVTLYGEKTPKGEYIYSLCDEWGNSEEITYKEALDFMTKGTSLSEEAVKGDLVF